MFLRVKKYEGSVGNGVEMEKKLYSVLIACMFSLLLFAVNSAVGQNPRRMLPFGAGGPQQRLASLRSPSVVETSERRILSSIHRRTNPETIAAKTAPAAPGDLDPTFGTAGKAFTSFGRPDRFGDAAAVQDDGKIVTAGTSRGIVSMDFALMRFNTDGSIDTTFGVGGKVVTDFGDTSEIVTAIAIQTDGKIVAVGTRSNYSFAMARYNIDGTLDTTFDGDGKVTNSLELGSAVVIAPDGKIITVGGAYASSVARFNADGSLDTTFEGDGIAGIPSGGYSNLYFFAKAVAVQADGKVVAAGFTSDYSVTPSRVYFTLFRFNANGSVDTTFDGDGRATAFYNDRQSLAYAVAIQPDGKIVTVGEYLDRTLYFAAARHNADGTLDTTFGFQGTTTFGFSGSGDRAEAVAIQPDGKIVMAGIGYNVSFAMARLNPNGTLDTTFDGDGLLFTPFSAYSGISSIATIADGRIVAVGNGFGNENSINLNVARYNANGSLDTTFDGDGKLLFETGVYTYDQAAAVAIQPDGKIVSAGGSEGRGALTRHNPDGSLDTTFDGDGRALMSDYGYLTAVTIQTDGKIVAAGYTYENGLGRFLLTGLNPDGSPDTTFDGDGRSVAAFPDFGSAYAYDAVIQPDGKIVVAGFVNRQSSQAYTFALARFNADGSLDNSFNADGRLTTDFDDDRSIANAVSIQTDGKIVAAGCALVADSAIRFALARYNTDGSLDASFDSDGKVTTNGLACANDMIIQTDGKILAAGNAPSNNGNGGTHLALARYNPNGSLDTTFDGDGLLTTAFDDHDSSASAVAIQPDGKIIAGGSKYYYDYYEGYNYDETAAFARYNGDGSLDTGFGAGGQMSNFLGVEGNLADFAMQSDGKIVAAGVGWIGDSDFLLTRYMTGTSSPSVRVSGRVTTSDGRGLRNATVSITDSTGVRRTATTSSFGLYAFLNVSAGGTYVIGVSSKRYRFASRNMTVNSNLADVDFVGLE